MIQAEKFHLSRSAARRVRLRSHSLLRSPPRSRPVFAVFVSGWGIECNVDCRLGANFQLKMLWDMGAVDEENKLFISKGYFSQGPRPILLLLPRGAKFGKAPVANPVCQKMHILKRKIPGNQGKFGAK